MIDEFAKTGIPDLILTDRVFKMKTQLILRVEGLIVTGNKTARKIPFKNIKGLSGSTILQQVLVRQDEQRAAERAVVHGVNTARQPLLVFFIVVVIAITFGKNRGKSLKVDRIGDDITEMRADVKVRGGVDHVYKIKG